MRFLVFSDSHGNTAAMERVASEYLPSLNYIIHLGDLVRDAEGLRRKFPTVEVISIPGNNDWEYRGRTELFLALGGVRTLLLHGHTAGVIGGTASLEAKAARLGAALVLYGHTHKYAEFWRGGTLFINPGSPSFPRGGSGRSCALVELGEGIRAERIEIE